MLRRLGSAKAKMELARSGDVCYAYPLDGKQV
jgi:hypothetical protein